YPSTLMFSRAWASLRVPGRTLSLRSDGFWLSSGGKAILFLKLRVTRNSRGPLNLTRLSFGQHHGTHGDTKCAGEEEQREAREANTRGSGNRNRNSNEILHCILSSQRASRPQGPCVFRD